MKNTINFECAIKTDLLFQSLLKIMKFNNQKGN